MTPGPRKDVLIVDDDEFVREVIEMSFASAGGWRPHMATSGSDGIRQACASQPDVILLDLTMPDLDGVSTMRELRADARTRDVPIVFLTADAQQAARLKATNPGVAGVITKPFDPIALPAQVRRLIEPLGPIPAAESSAAPTQLDAALLQLWKDHREQIVGQVSELAVLVEQLRDEPDAQVMSECSTLAHNLIGVLGSLGLYDACELARRIERMMRVVEPGAVASIADHVIHLAGRLGSELEPS